MTTHDPRGEAQRVVGDAYDVRVLEPSPPAVLEAPFSDDPTAREPVAPGRQLMSPVTNGDITWDDLCRRHPEFAVWCADRWLGAWRALKPLPDLDVLHATRDSWQTVAQWVVATARYRVNGKIGLRWVQRGFATPFFGDDQQVRVEGRYVLRAARDRLLPEPMQTPGQVAGFVGVGLGVPGGLFEPTTDGNPVRRLQIDTVAATTLSDWFGFATSLLAQLRVDYHATSPSLIQLWPEHFDLAVEIGDAAARARANYGASPGDPAHPEPYLYIGPFDIDRVGRSDPFWNEPFGASLPYARLLAAPDARAAAFEFFRTGAALLAGEPR